MSKKEKTSHPATNKFEQLYERALRAAEKGSQSDTALAAKAGLYRIDKKSSLYVTRERGGYGTMGFDYAARNIKAASELTGKEYDLAAVKRGTPRGYRDYSEAMAEGRKAHSASGRRSEGLLEPQLIGLEGKRVEVIDRDGKTRRFIVGKSTGWMPIHLEISRRGAHGGPSAMGPYKSVRLV